MGARFFFYPLPKTKIKKMKIGSRLGVVCCWGEGEVGSQDEGFRVQGWGEVGQDEGFRMKGSGFRVQGSGFRVQGSG
jgi:hypothetical protein